MPECDKMTLADVIALVGLGSDDTCDSDGQEVLYQMTRILIVRK
jgi:hypothetical protein